MSPSAIYADKIEMQNRLFAELSAMFGREAPLYDRSLAVNAVCNRAVCDLLAQRHRGFAVSDEELERASAERHGAIRIGRPDEFRWVGRFFACFGMEPHNFYDMTSVGAKSQPVIATAFRSVVHPEHRVFTSLLQTDYFDATTRARIERLLATRSVFSDRAQALIERSEREGGVSWDDAMALIAEGTGRIFKWTGDARDHGLYTDLCEAGFKIAADIACFRAHHLNHLTPNTLCMDLYTSAMKRCLGEMDDATFRARAQRALERLSRDAGADFLRLHFRHLTRDQIAGYVLTPLEPGEVGRAVESLARWFGRGGFELSALQRPGFKDLTEGPPSDTPVLLRQDAYKALTEPVRFTNADGVVIEATHTARFGEIEQRFYATTKAGRELYDRCLAAAEADATCSAESARSRFDAYEAAYARHFAPFPKTLAGLLERGLVYGCYEPTAEGLAARGTVTTTDVRELVRRRWVVADGLRYEDFLPVSAAGIFASNLSQYGTKSTAEVKPRYTKAMLEDILGKPILDADAVYRGMEADSLLETYRALGLLDALSAPERGALEAEAAECPPGVRRFTERGVLAARE